VKNRILYNCNFVFLELGRSLIITELGSNRSKERLDIVMKNLRTIAEEPNAVHG